MKAGRLLISSKQKIVVNGRFLTQRTTGVQRFASEITKELLKLDNDILVLSPRNIKHGEQERSIIHKKVGIFSSYFWEQLFLPLYLLFNGRPLLINLCNTAPVLYKNQVNIIHDTGYLENKHWYSKKFVLTYKLLMPLVIRRNKQIATVSAFSKEQLKKYYSVPDYKIRIIRNGFTPNLKVTDSSEKLTLPDKFVLYVGSITPRKNIETLIRAFLKIKDNDLHLILAGNIDTKIFGKSNILNDFENNERIHLLRDVSDKELARLYQEMRSLVFIPHYEGFGLPVLESVAFKKPVILSNIPVLKENFSNYAYFVNPNNAGEVSNAIKMAANNEIKVNQTEADRLLSLFSYKNSARTLYTIASETVNK